MNDEVLLKKIEENWNMFCQILCQKDSNITEDQKLRKDKIEKMLDVLADRLAVCPISLKGTPGSLVDETLKHLKVSLSLNNKFKLGLSNESVIFCCLLRSVGMVGDLHNDLYLANENNKYNKDNYVFNNKLSFMKVFDRTLFLLNHFEIKFSEDEMMAIISGMGNNENYKFNEPSLAFCVNSAVKIVNFQNEKEKSLKLEF